MCSFHLYFLFTETHFLLQSKLPLPLSYELKVKSVGKSKLLLKLQTCIYYYKMQHFDM